VATANLGRNLFFAGTFGAGALSLVASRNVFAPHPPLRTATRIEYAGSETVPSSSASAEPRFPRNEDTKILFDEFFDEWKTETQNYSDPSVALMHPAYHRILAMGTSVLPYIFDDMATGDGARWLPALDAITLGIVNPILSEHEMDADLMCQDWLNWWAKNEFLA
jgi:hypothetical protein